MLTHYKERYGILFRAVALTVVCLFLYNSIAFALAPKLGLTQPEFEEDYLIRSTLLASDALDKYVNSQINPNGAGHVILSALKLYRSDKIKIKIGQIEEEQEIAIIGIPGLLKNRGQLAKICIGQYDGMPVIFVDSNYFLNEMVIGFEKEKISELEKLMRVKGIATYKEMRDWILEFSKKPDLVEGKTSRQIADEINEKAHKKHPGINRLYERIKAKYTKALSRGQNARAESLLNFAEMWDAYKESGYIFDKDSRTVNLAAHEAEASGTPAEPVTVERERIAKSWIEQHTPGLLGRVIVSLSMEGNIPEFEGYLAQDANTKGGLGAYFGDKLEGLAAIGANGLGIQPGYSHVMQDGKKTKVNYDVLIKAGIMKEVLVGDNALMVRAWDEDPEARTEDEEDRTNPKVKVEVYAIHRGGTLDFILRSKILDVLYTDDRAHRFTQEIVFGKAVYELLKKLNIKPDILHLNEAHTVVAAAQMKADESFDDMAIVYTNHTLVPAGLETFSAGSLKSDVDRMMYVIGLPGNKAAKFRSIFLRPDGTVDFCYAAMKLADVINAVSNEHAKATARLFRNLYGSEFDKPVTGILNGSGETWKSDELKAFEDKNGVPNEEDLWNIHKHNKEEAFAEIEKRTGVKLDLSKPTAWAIRRLVDYKSQYPMLRFLVHILTADKDKSFTRDELKTLWFRDIPDLAQPYNGGIVESNLDKIFNYGRREKVYGLGMQVVVGGSEYMPFWVYEFNRWTYEIPELNGKFVYVPRADAKLLKMQATGADICVTMPRPLEEACGTSDQRTGLNGGVNIAIKGAGPVEWMVDYNEETGEGSGFFIGSYTKETQDGPEADNEKFYHEAPEDIFAKCEICARLFYEEGKGRWKRLMRNSYLMANERVTAEAMEQRYAEGVYLPVISKKLNAEIMSGRDIKALGPDPDLATPDTGPKGVMGSPAELLNTIKNSEVLFRNAINKDKGISVREAAGLRDFSLRRVQEEFKTLKDLGIFVPLFAGSLRLRFSDMILKPNDEEYTRTMINAINGIRYQVGKRADERPLYRGDIPSESMPYVRELVKMAIISETEKEFAVPEGKTMYHIIEQDVIPVGQRSTIAQAVNNKFYRDNKGPERIIILNEKQDLTDVIAEIRAKDSNALIDVALSEESHINAISDPNIQKLVFKTEAEFIQLEGVIKALRALHEENPGPILMQLYSIMAGGSPDGSLLINSGVYVFNLPKIAKENIENVSNLNKGLLAALAAA